MSPVAIPHTALAIIVVLWLGVGVGTTFTEFFPSIAKMAAFMGWFLIAAARDQSFALRWVSTVWPFLTMLFVAFTTSSQVPESGQLIQSLYYCVIVVALATFYSDEMAARERNVVLVAITADLVITGIRTYFRLQQDPLLSKYLATTEENRVEVFGNQDFTGIAGYGYAYVLAGTVFILTALLSRAVRHRGPIFIAACLGALLLFQLGFTTAVVLAAVFVVVSLILDHLGPATRILAIAMLFFFFWSGLARAMLRTVGNQRWLPDPVQVRFHELSDYLGGTLATGTDLTTRFTFWNQSIRAIWENGPFGLIGAGPNGALPGRHSEWLDLTSSYGLFVLPLLAGMVLTYRNTNVSGGESTLRKRVWIYFLILGMINPVLYSTILLGWLFYLPSLAHAVSDSTSAEARSGS